MLANSDFRELLSIFNAKNVRYLVVGGYAVVKYTEPRYTKDLDLWVQPDAANAQRVFEALREFGAPLRALTAQDFAHPGYFYQMGVPPVRVDILMSISGLDFDEAWSAREAVDYDGVLMPFISKGHLIASKLAAGRPQDLLDAASLQRAEP